AITQDSGEVKFKSNKGWVELNRQTGEILFKVKLNTYVGENAALSKHLNEHNEKIYFRGNLGIDINEIIAKRFFTAAHKVTGYIKLNGIKHSTTINVSFFQMGNENDKEEKILMTLEIPLKFSDYKMEGYFPEIKDKVIIMLLNQPINFVTW
ncbi:MAG: hypothetical protein Q8R57_15075, partial [Bacteroidota bacterium]|nr:hypothetical protein [Bacteroidota bacterium]